VVPAVIELALAAYLWSLLSRSVGVVLLYQPDLTMLTLSICSLLLVRGSLRSIGGAALLRGA
jgi:hypothetical protein